MRSANAMLMNWKVSVSAHCYRQLFAGDIICEVSDHCTIILGISSHWRELSRNNLSNLKYIIQCNLFL